MARTIKDRVAAIRKRLDGDTQLATMEIGSSEYVRAFSNSHTNWGGFRKGWGSRTLPEALQSVEKDQ